MARAIWTFEVWLDDADAPVLVEATSRDVAFWEKTTGKTLKYLYEHMPMQELVKVAHRAMVRNDLTSLSAAEFAEQADIEIRRERKGRNDDVDPTQPDH